MARHDSRSYAEALVGSRQESWHSVEARHRVREQLEKKLDSDKAMLLLYQVSGLEDNGFLHSFHREQLTKLSGESYPLENDKLRAITGLLGLSMHRFFAVDLPLPKRLRNPILPDVYSLAGELYPWKEVDVSGWDEKYTEYLDDWIRLQEGRDKKYDRVTEAYQDVYLEEKWSLRLGLAKEFGERLFERLQELLKLDLKKATTVEILTRNTELRQLISECNRYPVRLSAVLYHQLKDKVKELKATDPLSELCATSIMGALYGQDFDIDSFQEQVIQILWAQLADSQKSDEQRQMVELIRREISGEVYEGICETEVVA